MRNEYGALYTLWPNVGDPIHGRIRNCLARAGLTTRALIAATPDYEMLALRDMGRITLGRIREVVPYADPEAVVLQREVIA